MIINDNGNVVKIVHAHERFDDVGHSLDDIP